MRQLLQLEPTTFQAKLKKIGPPVIAGGLAVRGLIRSRHRVAAIDGGARCRYRMPMIRRWGLGSALVSWTIVGGCFSPDRTAGTGDDAGSTSAGTDDPSANSLTSTLDTTASTDPDSDSTDDPSAPTTGDPDSSGSSGEPVACDGPDGEPAAECSEGAPFCLGGTCVGCDEVGDGAAACAAVSGTTPVCVADTCSACTEHEQCGSGACRRATGECFPEANRLFVDNTDPNCGAGSGAQDSPICQVTTAMDVIDGQAGTEPWAIFVAGSPNPYLGTVDPSSGRPIAIIGPSQGLAATIDGGQGFGLDLWAQSPENYVAHATLRGSSAVRGGGGGCALDLADVAITGAGVGIQTGGCEIGVRRSLIADNFDTNVVVGLGGVFTTDRVLIEDASTGMVVEGSALLGRTRVSGHFVGGGIRVDGGTLVMVNSIVHQNEYENDGIELVGGQLTLTYSTIVGALECTGGATAAIRNSIILGHATEAGLVCPVATVESSVVNQGEGQGQGNVVASADELPMIFVDAAQYGGDYHVLPDSIPAGVAVWQDGDPLLDIDGDERPGLQDYAGADIP